ncbi:ImmA/IrrE family metallo-endopeptidase [Paenarthrobacter sp. NPDC089714]|uniref:ImmA/IrrE family metallo-endopeptidase n=1 Tax=Paenarthrobacter sp. NPDC089714 TaxID=3364377 RepID=UPI00381E2308
MFHPWGILRALAHIRLSWVVMPDGAPGRTNGIDIIWLNKALDQVERRCALTHELIHIEREHTGCQSATVEAEVRAEAARRLIPLDQLIKGLRWARSHSELADELWVTPEVLQDRFDHLGDAEWQTLLDVELQH